LEGFLLKKTSYFKIKGFNLKKTVIYPIEHQVPFQLTNEIKNLGGSLNETGKTSGKWFTSKKGN
jgi:hypothetical protein